MWKRQKVYGIVSVGMPVASILPANLFDDCPKQINHFLLNDPDLFNFLSCPPMLSIFYQGETLCAFIWLEQYIVGPRKMSCPWNGFGKSCLVKNVVLREGSRKDQGGR